MLRSQNLLFLDCQTTGGGSSQASILELAWCTGSALETEAPAVTSFVIKQEVEIPRRIKMITGISDSDMENAVDLGHAISALTNTCQILEQPSAAIIHFAQFELPFLMAAFERNSIAELPFQTFCTYQIARRLLEGHPSHGIRAIAGYFGAGLGELKRAGAHAQATWLIWKFMAQRLEERSINTVEQLHAWLQNSRARKAQRFTYPLQPEKRLSLPDTPGVYRMINSQGSILYVGKATSLKQRVNSYFRGRKKDSKTRELLSQVCDLRITVCETPIDAALMEVDEIQSHNPPYNIALRNKGQLLAYYSRDFAVMRNFADEETCMGPFRSERVMLPLLNLAESIRTGSFIEDTLFLPLPKTLLAEGWALFCINSGLEPGEIDCARDVLAAGMWLLRAQQQRLTNEADTGEMAKADEDGDGMAEFPWETQSMPTVEEIADRISRLLIHAAIQQRRAKRINRFYNCDVLIDAADRQSTIHVRNGRIRRTLELVEGTEFPAQSSRNKSSDAFDGSSSSQCAGAFDLATYDRLRVLITELDRMAASGAAVFCIATQDEQNMEMTHRCLPSYSESRPFAI